MTRPEIAPLHDAVRAAVESQGLRPLATKLGVPMGVVRSAKDGLDLSASSISALAKAFNLEFYVGPPRYDGRHTHDGSKNYSGEPEEARLSPALCQALCLGEGATEADALKYLAHLPHTAHEHASKFRAYNEKRAAILNVLKKLKTAIEEAANEIGEPLPEPEKPSDDEKD